MKLSPQKGGCWYCHEDSEHEDLYFCLEFDTFIHKSCIKKKIELQGLQEYDPELEIIRKEFGL